jgi:hypothetical protein
VTTAALFHQGYARQETRRFSWADLDASRAMLAAYQRARQAGRAAFEAGRLAALETQAGGFQ